jgi:polyhydroxybutyrate depolymerase
VRLLKFITVLALGYVPLAASAKTACLDSAGACRIPGGSYHVAWPPGVSRDKTVPAVVALRGYKGSGLGLIKSGKMVKAILSRGYAVITPEGIKGSWQFRGGGRDDVAFIGAVANDAVKRGNIARGRITHAGFSAGGSMEAYVACSSPHFWAGTALNWFAGL